MTFPHEAERCRDEYGKEIKTNQYSISFRIVHSVRIEYIKLSTNNVVV